MQKNNSTKKRLLLIFVFITLGLFACISPAMISTNTPRPTNLPSPTNTPKPPSSSLSREALGIKVEFEDATHVEYNDILIYQTNPPNSGVHFSKPMSAGFYDNNDPSVQSIEQPEGYIVHSLEHGYVAVWYNCTGMSTAECRTLKNDIRIVVEAAPAKVIIFPWTKMNEPIVLTSWGQILRLDNFDGDLIAEFISTNRSHPQAPEPNVP